MNLIIDANVIKGYYTQEVLNGQADLTGEAIAVVSRLGQEDLVYLDSGDQIASEWRDVSEPDWFREWYTDLLKNDHARLVPAFNCPIVAKGLRQCGFPFKGGDIWYVRTAHAVRRDHSNAFIVSEDVDFTQPDKKQSKDRLKVLLRGKGPVANYLEKRVQITVMCVARYINYVSPDDQASAIE